VALLGHSRFGFYLIASVAHHHPVLVFDDSPIPSMPDTVLAFSVANKYGGLPPPGCRFPTNLGHPRVAVGDEVQGPYEATFSIQPGNLMECLFNVVEQSWTLKAWFAYKIKVRGLKDTCDLEPRFPTWERVWEMIQQKRSTWEERYKTRKNEGTLTTQWELCEPKSTLELLACAVVVLACHIPANFDNEQQNACPLKWYPYYYEHNGRIFTLYRFMAYQNKLFAPYRTNTIHFESDRTALGMECWLQSWGYRIHQASEDFVNGGKILPTSNRGLANLYRHPLGSSRYAG
jgi:hypothetical protein